MIEIKLKNILKKRGLTLVELSEITGIDQKTLSFFQNQKTKSIHYSTLEKILIALDIDISELITSSNQKNLVIKSKNSIRCNLRNILKTKNMTLQQLSEQSGVNTKTLSQIQTYSTESIHFKTVANICETLKINVGDLYEYIDDEEVCCNDAINKNEITTNKFFGTIQELELQIKNIYQTNNEILNLIVLSSYKDNVEAIIVTR